MRRPALYSSSRPNRATPAHAPGAASGSPQADAASPASAEPATASPSRLRRFGASLSNPRVMWAAIVLLAIALGSSLVLRPMQRQLTQEDINAAVLKTMETQVMPSEYTRAYENIRPSVVRVVSYVKKSRLKDDPDAKLPGGGKRAKPKPLGAAPGEGDMAADEVEHGVGTGVVIIDKGVILTNLHVVSGADRIKVTFSDGLEALATVTGAQPENDLAVLQASKIPDDLIAATMRSTNDLSPGDKVLAVGFPFGIGPSSSGGIISGLGRAFRSPEGKQEMTNLIQFDAAANPGNSGGPLVTMDGEVVGIVTAILNPTSARTFIGIGFAVPIENAASAAGLPPF
ncbi:trypsin-like peptidase domain-containing protein [Ramlibacter sp.]|uniref:S1C family serine protease n=1 Tax=Ramlibacter sp. TaxID=1917967 RepID=UPI00180FE2D5|nr:trypsin-like peptidase domain-containing protein [Ramlibacter sp.]MBA2674818.1 trypsin-like peptidase domain-containing protein [Ramlibacter sp.]